LAILVEESIEYARIISAIKGEACVPVFDKILASLKEVSTQPDYIKEGMINFSKRRQQYIVLSTMRSYQQKGYNLLLVYQIVRFLTDDYLLMSMESGNSTLYNSLLAGNTKNNSTSLRKSQSQRNTVS